MNEPPVKKLDIDRDAVVDRLLREPLEATAGAPQGACLDAETLAAWADGTLGRGDRAAAETHAADCGRCQALLAAMVRTAPPAPAWRMPSLRWLAPLTVAATAALFWTLVPARRAPLEERGREETAASRRGIDQGGRVSPGEQPRVLPAAPPAGPAASAPASAPPAAAPAPALEADARLRRPDALASPRDSIEDRKRAAAKEAPASSDKLEKAAAPAEAKTLADTAIVSGAVREAPAPTTAPAAPARAQAAAAPAAARNLAMFRVTALVVVSPDAASRWRIMDDRTVQRSTDGGSTWENQQTGANVLFTAGASPSSLVCWLVGPGGTIRLSTDGRSWQPVPFPESTRLTGVTATDDKTVTVTTEDGRRFTSIDRGATWARIP